MLRFAEPLPYGRPPVGAAHYPLYGEDDAGHGRSVPSVPVAGLLGRGEIGPDRGKAFREKPPLNPCMYRVRA